VACAASVSGDAVGVDEAPLDPVENFEFFVNAV
jgi:hypothetical protein